MGSGMVKRIIDTTVFPYAINVGSEDLQVRHRADHLRINEFNEICEDVHLVYRAGTRVIVSC